MKDNKFVCTLCKGLIKKTSGKKLLDFYKEDYADSKSLTACLVSLAVAVCFSEPIRAYIPLNLLLLLVLVHAAYIGVQWYLENKRGW